MATGPGELAADATLRIRLEGGLERLAEQAKRLDALAQLAQSGWEVHALTLVEQLNAALAEWRPVADVLERAGKLDGGAPLVAEHRACEQRCRDAVARLGFRAEPDAPLEALLTAWAASARALARTPAVPLASGSLRRRRPRWVVSLAVVAGAAAAAALDAYVVAAGVVVARGLWFLVDRAQLDWVVWPTHVELADGKERRALSLEPEGVLAALASRGVGDAELERLRPLLRSLSLLRRQWEDARRGRPAWQAAALHASESAESVVIRRGHALLTPEAVWFVPVPLAQSVVQRCLRLDAPPAPAALPELLQLVPLERAVRAVSDAHEFGAEGVLHLPWPASIERRGEQVLLRRPDGAALLLHG